MKAKKLKEYITTIEKTSSTIVNIWKALKIIFYVLIVIVAILFLVYKQFRVLIIDIIQSPIWLNPVILKLWHILFLILILSFCLLIYFIKKRKRIKNLFKFENIEKLNIKFRWTYDIFNKVIIDFPPFCLRDNVKLQFKDDKHIPAQEFICPICSQEKQLKEIYSKYRSTKSYLESKYEKLSYFNTMRKANISIDDNLIEKV